ncbi:MAG: flavin reductase family protein [Saprospiraceae bacterium]
MRSFDPTTLSTPRLYGYLSSGIAPRPIAFVSTRDADGRVNLSPYSFFNVFGTRPPTLVFSPVRRGRDGSSKDTLDNVLATREAVVNIVNFPLVEQMSLASTEYPTGVNEFIKAGLTEVPSERVKPPRVAEAPLAFECRVTDVIATGEGGGAGNLVICEVVMIHIDERYLREDDTLDTTKLDLVARMGESWYCRASGEALFEIPKPIHTLGIGVDRLPEHVRTSHVLSANNLGRLGNAERLPTPEELAAERLTEELREIAAADHLDARHKLAKDLLERGEVERALRVLSL